MKLDGNAIVYCQNAFNTLNRKTAHGLVLRAKLSQKLLGFDGVADGFWGDLEQVFIQGLSLLFTFGILDSNHSTLGTALVVGKDNFDPKFITGFVQQSGQHPHGIEQLHRIKRLMNVGLDHRTIDACLSPFLDIFLLGMVQQISRIAFPGLRRNPFDICVESGFSKSFVSNTDSAKTPQSPRVINMKSQLFIGEIVKAIMNLNENIAVEERNGTTAATKKYISDDGKVTYGPFQFSDNYDGERYSDEELAREMAELDAMKANDPPEKINWKQAIQDSVQAYSQIDMFDYGTGKMSNQQAIADFYGWAIVKQILHEIEYSYNHKLKDQKPGQISKKLWQRMRDIRAGKLPKAEPIKYKNQCKPKPKQPESQPVKESEPTNPKPEKKENPMPMRYRVQSEAHSAF